MPTPMETKRAYSALEIKAVDAESREIMGIATTPTPDRMGDIVEPMGVTFTNPLPLLHQHDATRPVGQVKFEKATEDGIRFSARIPKIENEGALRERVDLAWDEIKHGLVRGVSIGFKARETSFMDDGGVRFIESEVVELSLVTIPANAEATIQTIKNCDINAEAATGHDGNGVDTSGDTDDVKREKKPGASGHVVKLAEDRTRKPFVIRNIIRKE